MGRQLSPPKKGDKVYWGRPERLYRVEGVDLAAYLLVDQQGRYEVASKSCSEFIDPVLRIKASLVDFRK